jgi:hypothetical protein
VKVSTAWAMPSRWTFEIPPIREFVDRWLAGCGVVVDPFCGRSTVGTLRNDIAVPVWAGTNMDAGDFCLALVDRGVVADAIIFDPPYSPRQISECYKEAGRTVTQADTRNATLYKRVRRPLAALLKPGGIALSFGWNSAGFGRAWPTEEILLVQHGGAHNDTICVAQRKPAIVQLDMIA